LPTSCCSSVSCSTVVEATGHMTAIGSATGKGNGSPDSAAFFSAREVQRSKAWYTSEATAVRAECSPRKPRRTDETVEVFEQCPVLEDFVPACRPCADLDRKNQ
jgi:hypothetical protein